MDGVAVEAALQRYRVCCEGLREGLQEIRQMPKEELGVKGASPVLGGAALHLVELKASSRATFLAVDLMRQHVADHKRKLDRQHLQLQNLIYKKQHLLREMKLCRDFKTREVSKIEKDEGLSIVVEEDDLAGDAKHQDRLALLTSEMQERKSLEESLAQAKDRRDNLIRTLEEKRTLFASLPEQLRALRTACQPLQTLFGMPEAQTKILHDRTKELSEPLYVLFRQLEALQGTLDNGVVVHVAIEDSTSPSAGKDDGTEPGGEEGRRGRKRAKTTQNSWESGTMTRASPASLSSEVDELAVILQITLPVSQSVTQTHRVRFQRMVAYNVVTAEAEGLASHTLALLFPDDTGRDFPSAAHFQVLQAAGIHGAEQKGAVYPEHWAARPFMWAQWISGLACLPARAHFRLEPSSRMVVQRITQRLQSQYALERQIAQLQSNLGWIPVHPSARGSFPDTAHCAIGLQGWQEEAAGDQAWRQFSATGAMLEEQTQPDDNFGCRLFTGTFQRGKNDAVSVQVLVSPGYPDVAPKISLRTQEPNGSPAVRHDIKDIELEANAFYDELVTQDSDSWNWLLSHQLRRAQACLHNLGTAEADAQPSIGGRLRRGRNRRQPFAFSAAAKVFFHR